MQASGARAALLDTTAPAFMNIAGRLSSSRRPRSGATNALFAPAAMLVGAVGLAAVWAALPKPTPTTAVVAPAPVLRPMVPIAPPQADAGVLGQWLTSLGAPVRLSSPQITLTRTADQAVAELRREEADMISAADLDARARLAAMRATFKATGLDARPYLASDTPAAMVSPAELKNPGLLAARLDVDPALARQMRQTARDLMAARTLGQAAAALPLATPVDTPVLSSPFGQRVDPFTGETAFHPGQDFAGRYGDAVHVTAPGVVSFAGQRNGYGDCVEVDHGYGLKTRYAHLSAFPLGVGSPVRTGDVIGRMGSTGRSTGVHLHYEVWASGRLLNPTPFLDAGAPAALKG